MSDRVDSPPGGPDALGARLVAVWFDRHVDSLHTYVSRRVGHELARDVVGETFRVALQQLDRYDPGRGDERAWLFGIATNVVRRHWRTELRRLELQTRATHREPASAIDPLLDVDDALDADRRLAGLVAGFARLVRRTATSSCSRHGSRCPAPRWARRWDCLPAPCDRDCTASAASSPGPT